MNPKILLKLGAVAKWAASPQGRKSLKTAAKFADEHRDDISAAGRLARNALNAFKENARQAAKNFREEVNKKD